MEKQIKENKNKEFWFYEYTSFGNVSGSERGYFEYFIRRLMFWKYIKVKEGVIVEKEILIRKWKKDNND